MKGDWLFYHCDGYFDPNQRRAGTEISLKTKNTMLLIPGSCCLCIMIKNLECCSTLTKDTDPNQAPSPIKRLSSNKTIYDWCDSFHWRIDDDWQNICIRSTIYSRVPNINEKEVEKIEKRCFLFLCRKYSFESQKKKDTFLSKNVNIYILDIQYLVFNIHFT